MAEFAKLFPVPAKCLRTTLFSLSLVGLALLVTGCGDDDATGALPQAPTFDWTAPEGDSFEVAMQAWDDAAATKSGDHPGWTFAAGIMQKQAEAGDARAKYHLGMLHYTGNGGIEFNHNLTGELVREAADDGYPSAHAFMALMMERGDGLLFRKGADIALTAWNKAAEGNHCGALRRLAQAWAEGELGLTKDAVKAAELKAKLPGCIKR